MCVSSMKCNLCTLEKYYIIYHPNMCTLNSRSELISTCRHSRKFTMALNCNLVIISFVYITAKRNSVILLQVCSKIILNFCHARVVSFTLHVKHCN